MTPVLIGISAFFWRVQLPKQRTNRFQVYMIGYLPWFWPSQCSLNNLDRERWMDMNFLPEVILSGYLWCKLTTRAPTRHSSNKGWKLHNLRVSCIYIYMYVCIAWLLLEHLLLSCQLCCLLCICPMCGNHKNWVSTYEIMCSILAWEKQHAWHPHKAKTRRLKLALALLDIYPSTCNDIKII